MGVSNETLLAIVVALIAASPGLYGAWMQRKRDREEIPTKITDIANKLTEIAMKLIEPVSSENAQLRREMADLETKYSKKIAELEKKLDSCNKRLAERTRPRPKSEGSEK